MTSRGWLFMLLFPASAHTQQSAAKRETARRIPDTTSTIHGVVKDSTGRALDSIEVYALTSGRSARTDVYGRYTLTNLIEGPTRLRARHVGWKPVDTTLVLAGHSDLTLNFTLGSRIGALDTVRVIASCPPRAFAGFTCRRKAGVGVFRDSAELAALKPEYIADMLDGIPGLRRVGNNAEATTRWRCLSILVDGHPPMPVEMMWYDTPWWVKNTVAIEFYQDASTAPEWYRIFAFGGTAAGHRRSATPCSLIVYWLKGSR